MMLCPWVRHFTLLASGGCPCTYCKSLWIRVYAKWLNVNVNVNVNVGRKGSVDRQRPQTQLSHVDFYIDWTPAPTAAHTLVLTFVSTERHLLLWPIDSWWLWSRLNNREVGILSMPRWKSRKCLHDSYNTTNCSGSYFNYCCLSVIFFVCIF